MKKLNQTGFGIVVILATLIVAGLIGTTIWVVIINDNEKNSSNSPSSTPQATNTSQAEVTKFCAPTENDCISYDKQKWTSQVENSKDQNSKDRQGLTLTHRNNVDVVVSFSPYVYGIGYNCEAVDVTVKSVTQFSANKAYSIVSITRKAENIVNSKVVGTTYSATLEVFSTDKANELKPGKQKCYPLSQYGTSGEGISMLTATNLKNYSDEQSANTWLSGPEAKEAIQVLESLENN